MKEIEILGEERKNVGKTESIRIRKNNIIPCVLYGKGKNIHFSVAENKLKKIIFTPKVYIINLTIDNKQYKTILQDMQFQPVTDRIIHSDFMEISEDRKIIMQIPVKLNGLSKGVQAGGKQMLHLRRLKVKGLPKNLPDTLDIDVTNIELGKSIKANEVSFPNIELLTPPPSIIVDVKLTRAAKAMAEPEAPTEEETKDEQ